MANKVLGIEIGQNLTRVAEIDYKAKNPKVYNLFSFATPPEMVSDGNIEVNSIFSSILKGKLKEYKIKTNKAIFVLNSTRIASREIELPNVKEKQIENMINMNASDYFPVDLTQYQLVHEVVDRFEIDGEKKLRLSVLAVPKELINSYERLAASSGLALVGLDYTGNAIKQLMIKEIPGEVKVTIKVDEAMSIITIMEGDVVKLQRIINYGIAEAIEEIQDSEVFGDYLSFMDAVNVARRRTCMYLKADRSIGGEPERDSYGNEVDSVRLANMRANVTDNLQSLVGSIARILDYYQSRNSDKTIERIFLIGLGADFSGLSKLMTNELNHKVVPLQQYDGLVLAKNINQAVVKVAEYFTCIGSALNTLPIVGGGGKAPKSKNVQPVIGEDGQMVDGPVEPAESYAKVTVFCVVCIIVAIGLVAYSIFSNLVLKSANMTLQSQVNDLQYAQEIYSAYELTKSENVILKRTDAVADVENNKMVDFLEELEKKMPSEIQVMSLSASLTGIDLEITVRSKKAVADVVSQLRTFDSISVSTLSEIKEQKNEAGVTVVQVTISCLYVTQPGDNAKDIDGEATTEESTEASTENN